MKWGRCFAVIVVAAVLAPAAVAATPAQIARDLADNGRLDGNYTKAELRAALVNPTLQGYPSATVPTRAEIQRQVGKRQEKRQRNRAVGRGGLPFTGLELALVFGGGALLAGGGVAVRRFGRPKREASSG